MYSSNKTSYCNIIIHKAEMEHWEIVVDSDTDEKLLKLLFDGKPIVQKKQKHKVSLESVFFIIYGKTLLEDFLQNGYREYTITPPKKKKQSK